MCALMIQTEEEPCIIPVFRRNRPFLNYASQTFGTLLRERSKTSQITEGI